MKKLIAGVLAAAVLATAGSTGVMAAGTRGHHAGGTGRGLFCIQDSPWCENYCQSQGSERCKDYCQNQNSERYKDYCQNQNSGWRTESCQSGNTGHCQRGHGCHGGSC